MIRFRKSTVISDELRASMDETYDMLLEEVNAALRVTLRPVERAPHQAEVVSGQARRDEIVLQVQGVTYYDDE